MTILIPMPYAEAIRTMLRKRFTRAIFNRKIRPVAVCRRAAASFLKLAFIVLVSFPCVSKAAVSRISDYPNTNSPGSNYLFVLAVPGVTNYNFAFGQLTNALQQLMVLNQSNAVRNVKQPFATNYTVVSTDDLLLTYGTNQLITMPDCTNATTRTGKRITISSTNANGSFVVTNANGVQAVFNNSLSYTNSGAGSVTFTSSGANWWPDTD
jgi:hypothetical protein